jgi:hypothetical protein
MSAPTLAPGHRGFMGQLGLTLGLAVGLAGFGPDPLIASSGQCCKACGQCGSCPGSQRCYCFCDCSGVGVSYCWKTTSGCLVSGCVSCPC